MLSHCLTCHGGTCKRNESLLSFNRGGCVERCILPLALIFISPSLYLALLLCRAVSDGDHEATCTDKKSEQRDLIQSHRQDKL